MVVGTVRHPESVDAALRRPGRLSCDITLPLPDASTRIEILHKLLDGYVGLVWYYYNQPSHQQ